MNRCIPGNGLQCAWRRARSQRGQALTEFLVAAVALVPLFLLIPLIAKMQDISHATQMASRYLAFDALVYDETLSNARPESQLADEVRRRFFSNANAPIKSNDVAGDFLGHHNLYWRGPTGQTLIRSFADDVNVSFGAADSAQASAGFSAASDGSIFGLHQRFDLQARGIYTANVSVALANMPAGLKFYEPFDRIDLAISRSTSVAIGSWAARNPQQVESKIAADALIFPAASLAGVGEAVGPVVSVIDVLAALPGPQLGKLEFWRDVVPDDRLRSQP